MGNNLYTNTEFCSYTKGYKSKSRKILELHNVINKVSKLNDFFVVVIDLNDVIPFSIQGRSISRYMC